MTFVEDERTLRDTAARLEDLRARVQAIRASGQPDGRQAEPLAELCDDLLSLAGETSDLLAAREADLDLLFDVNNRIVSVLDPDRLGDQIVDVVTRRMDLERCSLFVHDLQSNCYRLVAARGLDPELIGQIAVQPGEGIVGHVIRTRQTLLIEDIEKDDGLRKRNDPGYSTRSLLSVPLEMGGDIIGVINVNNKKSGTVFTEQDRRLLEILAGTAAVALVNARLYHRAISAMTYIQNIIENIPCGILVVDRTGHITLCNRTTHDLTPVLKSHIEACRLNEVFGPSFRVHLEEVFARIWREGYHSSYEVVVEDENRHQKALGLSGSVVRDQNQEIIGALVLIQDLAEMRELEHLRHLERMKSNFISTVSHELRTPLTSMIASISLLDAKTLGDLNEKQMNLIAILSRNSHRLLTLINDILDLSRLESGKVALALEPLDFNAVVTRVSESLASLAQNREVELECVPYGGEPVMADPDRIEQVLVNLVGNAFKFTPKGGKVTVQAERLDGVLLVHVKDTGIGIPEDQVEKVFHKFHQGEDTMTRTYGGTGLGLAISRHIVEMHGGRIWCESEKGRGSTFSFTIPDSPTPQPQPH